jgi:peptidoglycan/LPS O-acetylase OafA/YrhL
MQPQKNIHFNGLNGIRAICALAVVISHSSISLSLIGIKTGPLFGLGAYGVTAFFALSGFLITYLLMEEKTVHGAVSIQKFYVRRILRIWPLYFGYMLIALLADVYIFHFTDFSSLGYYLLFFPNIPFSYEMVGMKVIPPIYLLGHFWSLGVEEQFYAFYPWLVKLFKKIFTVLISMFTLVIVIKLIAKFISAKTNNPFWYSWADNTRFDAMAIGGMGAWLYKHRLPLVMQIVKSKIVQLLVAFIVVLVLINMLKIPNSLSHMLVAVVTIVSIYYAHLFEKPYINLRNRYIDYLGKISFGIYVYHPLAIGLTGLLMKGIVLPELFKIPAFILIIILFTVLLASVSYRYFENYFLKLKFKYAVVKSKD